MSIRDRVLETTISEGTGSVTLLGQVAGYDPVPSGLFYYGIEAVDGEGTPSGAWEIGLGTRTGAVLTRASVFASSSGGLVAFAAGTKNVYASVPADLLNELVDGGDTTLHYHDADRARANHTGTQLAATISDFSAAVLALNSSLDHGTLAGLGDDDHSLYLLASAAGGRAAFASNWTDLTDGGTTTLHNHTGTYQPLDSTLTALAGYNTNGIICQTAADTFAGRTITGTSNQVVVANGSGVSGNPTLSLPQDIHTSANPQFATIEVGHATQNTLGPGSGAGLVAVEGVDLVTISATQELDNKTLDSSVGKGTWTASGTWTLPAFTLGGTVSSNGQSFSGTIANLGSVTTVDLNGGTIDGTVIGGSSPAAGTFTAAQVTGNLQVDGNLTVSGTTTTFDTETLSVEDPLIKLARNNGSGHAVDIGLYGLYDPSGTDLYAGLFFDATDSKWKLFSALQEEPTTTVNTAGTGYARGTLVVGGLEVGADADTTITRVSAGVIAVEGSTVVTENHANWTDLTDGGGTTLHSHAIGNITGLGANVATALATFSSANIAAACTDETGSGALVFATSPGFTTAANPVSDDGAALGTTALGWSDLHLATGALINVANGNAVITHSSGIFTVSTGDLRVTTAGTNAASVVTVDGTQTLANKTLTAPKFANAGFIADANGNELIIFTTTASAVNEVTVANGATGNGPILAASGETDVDLHLRSKAAGAVKLNSTGGNVIIGGAATASRLRFMEPSGSGTNYTEFVAQAQAGNITYTLPPDDGDAGEQLQTDGNGNLTWEAAAGSAASQSDQETGTSTTTFVSPGRQHFHPSANKGWIFWDGTGTVAIKASYNVNSLTDNTTGDYTINWETDFSSKNYAVGHCAGRASSGRSFVCGDDTAESWQAASFNARTINADAYGDLADAAIIAAGDHA